MTAKVYDIFTGKEINPVIFADFDAIECMIDDMLPEGAKFFEATDYQVNPAWDAEDKE